MRPLALAIAVALIVGSALLTGCSRSVSMAPPTKTPVPFVGAQTTPTSNSSAGTAKAGHLIISIKPTGFEPSNAKVKVGGRVVWQNNDTVAHTITIQGGPQSGQIAPGGTASHVFTQAGTFNVSDTAFNMLVGTITVSK